MANLVRIELLIVLIVLGYIAGLPALRWTLDDGRSISRRVWATLGRHRSHWERQLYVAYALCGWPAVAYMLWWRNSRLRHELRRERSFERDRGVM
jgi:hypothetical protein